MWIVFNTTTFAAPGVINCKMIPMWILLTNSVEFNYLPIFPKMIPISVDDTLTLALMLQKSCGAKITGCGRSTSFKSPTVANSRVSLVWLAINTSNTISYLLTCFSVHRIRESRQLRHFVQLVVWRSDVRKSVLGTNQSLVQTRLENILTQMIVLSVGQLRESNQ